MQTKQGALKELVAFSQNYEIDTTVKSKNLDPTQKNAMIYEVQTKVTVFEFGEADKDGRVSARTRRVASGYAQGATLESAEDGSIVRSIENLGILKEGA